MALPLLFFSNPDGSYTVDARDYQVRFAPERIYFTRGRSMVALEFPGADTPVIERLEAFRLRANFFKGGGEVFKTAIPTALAYRNLYPGIDAIWRSSGRSLKSEFVVAPQSNAMSLRLRYSGARRVAITKDGGLEVHTAGGILRESPPVLYQVSMSGQRIPVAGHYRLAKSGVVSFGIGAYDRGLPLYIDPTISYSSYLGGSRAERAAAVATDMLGNIYVAGHTDSPSFPVKSPLRAFAGNTDAFVAKLSPAGSQILWATFLGGSADDRATGLALDPAGNVFVVGYTTSANFPVVQPLQSKRSGARDAFIAKIDSSGQALLFSTYFGGAGVDTANTVAVDPSGLVYVAGETLSADLRVKTPVQLKNGGKKDSFLLKLNAYFAVEFATYLGGNGDDRATALAVSADGSSFLAGCTASTNFPVQSSAQPALKGKQDAFVTRVSPSGNSLVYSTYLGGAGSNDCAAGIAIDPNLTAFVAGVTASADFPLLGAFQNKHAGGGVDAFLTKYTAGGAMTYSTYLGGRSVDLASAVGLDSAGRAYIAGYTASTNFPSVSAVQASFAGVYDGFLFRLEPSGVVTNFSTFLGHTGSDAPFALALTTAGDAILAGATTSAQFPVVSPLQPARSGASDAFVSRLAAATF